MYLYISISQLGAVADATATHVQVELHSRLKKVMVVRERVAVVGDKFGATEDGTQQGGTSMGAPAIPFTAATPMHGGQTPMHGGATPMHDSMGYVDFWRKQWLRLKRVVVCKFHSHTLI